LKMLAARAAQVTSKMAEEGELFQARKVNQKWDKFLASNAEVNKDNQELQNHYRRFQDKNKKLVKTMNKNVQRKVRRGSITILDKMNKLDKEEQNQVNEDMDNLSNEGSDDEDAVNYFQFKREASCCYAHSPVRSVERKSEKKKKVLGRKSSIDSFDSDEEDRQVITPPSRSPKFNVSNKKIEYSPPRSPIRSPRALSPQLFQLNNNPKSDKKAEKKASPKGESGDTQKRGFFAKLFSK